MKTTLLAVAIAAALAFAAPVAAQTIGPMGIIEANVRQTIDIVANGYDDRIVIDLLGFKEIENETDATRQTVSPGKTITIGNGGTTAINERAIPDALCIEYTAKGSASGIEAYCDGEVRFAVTSGAGQSSHYLGDVIGSKDVCELSTKTRSGGFRSGFFITQVDDAVDGGC